MLASIRHDLYQADLRIIGRRLRDQSLKLRDPILWEVVGHSDDLYILRDPFGELWEYESIDLDFKEN
jgi:hypothetical protein